MPVFSCIYARLACIQGIVSGAVEIRDFSEQFAKALTGRMAAERVELKVSHENLAKAAGIHRSTVSRIESRQMRPTLEVVHSMATALGLDFPELVRQAEADSARLQSAGDCEGRLSEGQR